MKLKLPYMGKIAGLALIQSTVSAVGLLITCIVWNKWQSCRKRLGEDYVIYRTGLWKKCIDRHISKVSDCSLLPYKAAELKWVTALMFISMAMQTLAVITGVLIRRYERQQSAIFVPILFNFTSALCGTIGLILYAISYDKEVCQLSASYVMGWVGVFEAYLSCILFIMIAFGK